MKFKDFKSEFKKLMKNFDSKKFLEDLEKKQKWHKAGYPLDNLPLAERQKYCWCKEEDTHCGECSCGNAGHVRSHGPVTAIWCDKCYKKLIEEEDE